MESFYDIISKKYDEVSISKKTWKIKFQATGKFTGQQVVMGNHEQELNKEAGEVEEAFEPQTKDFAAALVHLEIYEIEPEKSYRVELTKKQGFIKTFETVVKEIREELEN